MYVWKSTCICWNWMRPFWLVFFRVQQYGANVTSQHTSGAYLSGGGGGVSSSPIYIPPSAPAQHGQQQHQQSAAAGAAGTGMVHNTSVPANLNTYSQVGKATAAQHSWRLSRRSYMTFLVNENVKQLLHGDTRIWRLQTSDFCFSLAMEKSCWLKINQDYAACKELEDLNRLEIVMKAYLISRSIHWKQCQIRRLLFPLACRMSLFLPLSFRIVR